MKKQPWASSFTRHAPGTCWCLPCAGVGLAKPAICTVDEDPCCVDCAQRHAATTGCEPIPFKSVAAPQPNLPDNNRVEIPTKGEDEMPVSHKLSAADKQSIRDAAPSVTNSELARKYGVEEGTIWYHRKKARAAKPAAAATKPAKAAPSALQPRHYIESKLVTTSDPLDAILGTMNESQCDAAWSILAAQDKARALRLLISSVRVSQ